MTIDDTLELQYVVDIRWWPDFKFHIADSPYTGSTRKVDLNDYELVGEYRNKLLYERQRPYDKRGRV